MDIRKYNKLKRENKRGDSFIINKQLSFNQY